jgi:serine/threonine-protein kinase ATR
LLWDQGDYHQALLQLQQEVSNLPKEVLDGTKTRTSLSHSSTDDVGQSNVTETTQGDTHIAKAFLLLARWMEHTGQCSSDDIIHQYEKVKRLQPRWEKAYFFLGKYYDTLFSEYKRQNLEAQPTIGGKPQLAASSAGEQAIPHINFLPYVLSNYGGSLIHGHRYIFQSMPRMLTLWLDFGANFLPDRKTKSKGVSNDPGSKAQKAVNDCMDRTNRVVVKLVKKIPVYQWYTCLPQLVSRICHRHPEVFALLEEIILKVLSTYPQQAMWSMIALHHSRLPIRKKRAISIFRRAKEKSAQLDEVLSEAEELCNHLLELSDFATPKNTTSLSIGKSFRKILQIMPTRLIVPLQHQLTATLPTSGKTEVQYNPFPELAVTISGFHDKVRYVIAALTFA